MKETPAEYAQAPPDHDTVFVLRVQSGAPAPWQLYLPSSGQRLHFSSLPALLTYLSTHLGPPLPDPPLTSPLQS